MKALLLVCTGLFFAGISIIEKEKKQRVLISLKKLLQFSHIFL